MIWHSQAGQDRWIASALDGLRGGYFVDIGAYDGVEHSNTLALERDYHWRGICIEPNHEAFTLLAANRASHCIRAAVGDHDGTCRFDGVQTVQSGGEETRCATLRTLLTESDAPLVIDYLSIDVEGAELAVLAGMDFTAWTVWFITIEHNLYRDGPEHKERIYDALTSTGFERIVEDVVAPGYGPYEDWYRNTALRCS